MNRIHKTVFNRALGVWQAVSELAKGRGKGGQKTLAISPPSPIDGLNGPGSLRFPRLAIAAVCAMALGNGAAWAVDIAAGSYSAQQGMTATGTNNAVVTNTTGPVSITINSTAGSVHGILANTATTATAGVVTVTLKDVTIINNAATGPNIGISIVNGANNTTQPSGGETSTLTLSGANAITTRNGGGILMNVFGNHNATATISDLLTIDINALAAANSDGLEITTRKGDATLEMSGMAPGTTINMHGNNGNGILVRSYTQTNQDPTAGGGNVTANIGANVTINMLQGGNNVGDMGLAYSGILVATGVDTNGNPTSNPALASGTALVNSAATINVGSSSNAVDGVNGITAKTAYGTVDVTNSGTITTYGAGSHGIVTVSSDGAMEINNAGTVQAHGANSYGMLGETNATSLEITNSGTVTSDLAAGVVASTTANTSGGHITVSNSGSIKGTTGIIAGDPNTTSTTPVTVDNTATGRIEGTAADGLFIENPATVNNAGDILGQTNGISLTHGGTVDHTGGSIIGATADGIYVAPSDGSPSTVNSQALIQGGAHAVRFVSGDNFLNLQSGSRTIGAVLMGSGADTVTVFGGADISGLTRFDNGAGASALIFDGYSGAAGEISSSGANPWAQVQVTNGAAVRFADDTLHRAAVFSVTDGSLTVTGAAGANTLSGPVDLGAAGKLVFAENNAYTFGQTISGAGQVVQSGTGATTLTGANAYFGGTTVSDGILAVAATSADTQTNLGSGEITITGSGVVQANTGGAFAVNNALAGNGTFAASNAGQALTFDAATAASTGANFTGTLVLTNNAFALGGPGQGDANTQALTRATLVVGAGNVSTANTNVTQTIGGLNINTGTMVFGNVGPDDYFNHLAPDVATTTLDVSHAGTVQVTIPPDFTNAPPIAAIQNLPLLQQDDGMPISTLVSTPAGGVTGTGNLLVLKDQNGNVISAPVRNNITDGASPNPGTRAIATYDYRLLVNDANGQPPGASTTPNGLYVGFGLTQLNLVSKEGGAAGATTLFIAAGATGLAADLDARITDTYSTGPVSDVTAPGTSYQNIHGDLVIDAGRNDPAGVISLSNASNNYTGVTDVRSGALRLGASGVLGAVANGGGTSDLIVWDGATFDSNGFDQSVGALDTEAGGTVRITAGSTLTITAAQRNGVDNPVAGLGGRLEAQTLTGAGTLKLDASMLRVNGGQTGFTGEAQVTGGSTLVLNTANAFDASAGIHLQSATDTLAFGGFDRYGGAAGDNAATGGLATVVISGSGVIEKNNPTTVVLGGVSNQFTGTTQVIEGVLRIEGVLGDGGAPDANNARALFVHSGATLAGNGDGTTSGIVGGNVTIQTGGILAPNAGGAGDASRLTIDGNLNLQSGSILNYNLGQANFNGADNPAAGIGSGGGLYNDVVDVNGKVTLGGSTLNVTLTPGQVFEPGVYRLINYTVDSGLTAADAAKIALGAMPAESTEVVQTSVANQINLVVSRGSVEPLTFWDGGNGVRHGDNAVSGGDGVWQNTTGNDNWTKVDGAPIGTWEDGGFAVFQGEKGTVQIDNSLGDVKTKGMNFATDGYVLTGGPLTLTPDVMGESLIRIDDFSPTGGTTTLDARLIADNTTTVVKSGRGRLVLAAPQDYTADTVVRAGTLQAGGENTFSPNSNVTVDPNGRLDANGADQTIKNLTNNGTVIINAGPGAPAGGPTTLTVDGNYAGGPGSTVIMGIGWSDDNSDRDKLVINGDVQDGSRTALNLRHIYNPESPRGAQTHVGFDVVDVAGNSPAGAFFLSPLSDGYRNGTIAAGLYNYSLIQGGNGGNMQNWYLVSAAAMRPEVGSYLNNRYAALSDQMHTLHDRQGQANGRFTPGLERDPNDPDANGWVRFIAKQSRNHSSDFGYKNETYSLHLGGDILRHNYDDGSSVRAGAMALLSRGNGRSSNSQGHSSQSADGDNLGLYATWYAQLDPVLGAYVDAWAMGGRFNNKVQGSGLAEDKYHTDVWSFSLEAGHGFLWRESRDAEQGKTRRIVIQPQAQVVFSRYSADDQIEKGTGTRITGMSGDSWTTRLGVRLFSDDVWDAPAKPGDDSRHGARPFAELNWLHTRMPKTMSFDGEKARDKLPGDSLELKIGVETTLAKDWRVWGYGGVQSSFSGSSNYSGYVSLGLRKSW